MRGGSTFHRSRMETQSDVVELTSMTEVNAQVQNNSEGERGGEGSGEGSGVVGNEGQKTVFTEDETTTTTTTTTMMSGMSPKSLGTKKKSFKAVHAGDLFKSASIPSPRRRNS